MQTDTERIRRRYGNLRARRANQCVNVQRLYMPSELPDITAETKGTKEWQMRNQLHAWIKYMTLSMEGYAL